MGRAEKFRRPCVCAAAIAAALAAANAPLPGQSDSAAPGRELARRALELIHARELGEARALFDPRVLPDDIDRVLLQAHFVLAVGSEPSIELVHQRALPSEPGVRLEEWVYHLYGADGSVLAFVTTRQTSSDPVLTRLLWEPSPRDLEQRFPFELAGHASLHYLLLGLALAAPLACLYAGFRCLRRRPRPAWLWLPFVLIGIGRLEVPWLTGPFEADYLQLHPAALQWLGAGVFKEPAYDPWTLSLSLPLGALIFLWRERRRSSAGHVSGSSDRASDRSPCDNANI